MANAYESGARKNIPAVLVYLFHQGRVLMLHRVSPDRPDDFHAGKWNGLGGKCEMDEDYASAALRETEEECGIRLRSDQLRFVGFIQFPNFKPKKAEDWSVMLFRAEVDPDQVAQVPERVAEGSLHWIPAWELLGLNLWPGDREFLPRMLGGERFHGAIWYGPDGQVERSSWSPV